MKRVRLLIFWLVVMYRDLFALAVHGVCRLQTSAPTVTALGAVEILDLRAQLVPCHPVMPSADIPASPVVQVCQPSLPARMRSLLMA